MWTPCEYNNWPSRQVVEKKAMLRVSKGFSWVHSGVLFWGSDSPVREELSTYGESYSIYQLKSQKVKTKCLSGKCLLEVVPEPNISHNALPIFVSNCIILLDWIYILLDDYLTTLSCDDADVSRHTVSTLNLYQITHYQHVGIDLVLLPIPDYYSLLWKWVHSFNIGQYCLKF